MIKLVFLKKMFSNEKFWREDQNLDEYVGELSDKEKEYIYKTLNSHFIYLRDHTDIDYSSLPEWIDEDVRHIAIKCMSQEHIQGLFS